MESEVRYATTTDGVRIAYRVEGKGPPIIVCPFFVESFSVGDIVGGDYDAFMQGFGRNRTLIRYDVRGTGLSQRDVGDFSHDAHARDLAAVAEAAGGGEPVILYAPGVSGPRGIDLAVNHERLVSKLVLYSTFTNARSVLSDAALAAFAQLARENWPVAAQSIADLSGREEAADRNVMIARLFRESTDGETCSRLLLGVYDSTDVEGLLGHVKVPTLVIAWDDARLFTAAHATKLATGIENARFVLLKGGPWLPAEEAKKVFDAVNEFAWGEAQPDVEGAASPARDLAPDLRTILWTDLVGHTEMMQRLGDERGRDVLREHERITRDVLKAHGGTEVKTMGDGFMASFGSVTKAVECAVALQRAFADHEGERLSVRVGLNAGEPIEEEGPDGRSDLFGATVILASRIAAKAEGGEILVADTVRGLCSGKGFLFADRGEFVAKGFEEPVRVYEVRWRG